MLISRTNLRVSGGLQSTYLMVSPSGTYSVHSITRFDGGSFYKTSKVFYSDRAEAEAVATGALVAA